MNNFKDFDIKPEITNFVGEKIKINNLLDKEIIVVDFRVLPSNYEGKGDRLDIQIEYRDEPRVIFTGGKYLRQTIEKVPKDKFPFKTKIKKNGEYLEFT
ncbi:hypothetical protein [Flavobacterium sp. GT3P67]|uniref:hypothetical protein n=1 Tax=Flavobacterium sp. GT3P67 TaxID=2541722 RepID=UPI00104C95CB|nr:hypothetical protein [Flavobacterium sp. GT3P67]TDE53785.1 hypothetical protein E0H99_07145 [Flavobacterium sp. GT3P67]